MKEKFALLQTERPGPTCPKCQQLGLVYDGSVIWSHGSQPERKLATKAGFAGYRRVNFETAHYFHCGRCGTKYYDEGFGVLSEG